MITIIEDHQIFSSNLVLLLHIIIDLLPQLWENASQTSGFFRYIRSWIFPLLVMYKISKHSQEFQLWVVTCRSTHQFKTSGNMFTCSGLSFGVRGNYKSRTMKKIAQKTEILGSSTSTKVEILYRSTSNQAELQSRHAPIQWIRLLFINIWQDLH